MGLVKAEGAWRDLFFHVYTGTYQSHGMLLASSYLPKEWDENGLFAIVRKNMYMLRVHMQYFVGNL